MLAKHLFISSTDGALYDTRARNWSALPPLRPDYSRHHSTIKTVAQFKAALRAGAYAWPGGYSIYFITDDGAVLCHACAKKEARQIIPSIAQQSRDGWRVLGCACTADDEYGVVCDHCNTDIHPEP